MILNYKHIIPLILLLGILSACDFVHDKLEDCPNGVFVQLQVNIDAGLEFEGYRPNAFLNGMNEITLWIFDSQGKYVSQYTESAALLKANDNSILLPLNPGIYNIVSWTATDDEHHLLPELIPGISQMEELTLWLYRDELNRQNKQLSPLWHGIIKQVAVEANQYTRLSLSLTKNSNTVITVLQDTSGKDIDAEHYDFAIHARNGHLAHDNSLLDDDHIMYGAYHTETAIISNPDDEGARSGTLSVARAELNTLRLMANSRDTRFVITNKKTGKNILNINLIEYLILTRQMITGSTGVKLTNQQYLDYEDVFSILFFVSPTGNVENPYVLTTIQINGWVIRINDFEI